MRLANEHEMALRLRKDKAKYEGAYTRTKTKLMMTLEGGLSSKMQLMENLSLLSAAFEDVVRAVESLEAHYETVGDSSRLNAIALELEGMEEGFSEIERIVVSVSRTVPAGQSAIKEQSERLEKEIRMRKQEITKVLHDLEKTYAGCQKQLEQKLTPKKTAAKGTISRR